MSILVGIIGKPNVGKSTFFSALTENQVEIGNYPFTTIESNKGVTYVRSKCPHVEIGRKCSPRFGKCNEGIRMVPVEVIDVAGLVPGAHEGKGLGNKFLDDLRRADGFIQVIDGTGSLDRNGNFVGHGKFDPLDDSNFVHEEIVLWLSSIISDGLIKGLRKIESEGGKIETFIATKVSGLGIDEKTVSVALKRAGMPSSLREWNDETTKNLAEELISLSKPGIIVATKGDRMTSDERKKLSENGVIVVSGDYELVLRRATKAGLIDYNPGDKDFRILREDKLNREQMNALEAVRSYIRENNGTGVQEAIEKLVYSILKMIVVYPVEDETHWTDKGGNVLPDALLMKDGSTALDLAFKIHTDLGDNFIRAINGRSKRILGKEYVLKDNDIIKIISSH